MLFLVLTEWKNWELCTRLLLDGHSICLDNCTYRLVHSSTKFESGMFLLGNLGQN